MSEKNTVNFIFELNQLKRQKHSGWRLAGVKDPYSIADHIMRSAQIGYILASMEGNANPEKVAAIMMIHENGEARIGDQTKVGAKYFSKKEPEKNAFLDQLENLSGSIADKWKEYYREIEERNTPEGIIAKDADWLETAFQAKEYMDIGYVSAIDWINNVEKALETKSAKILLEEMKKTDFTE
ncbi:MAG TPA: HAD family hydrolase [Candidatus Moranbacteria bacterium]|nr:HAD family hydrolase [Candidatus Moranbacteria bacterium]